jgi:hypothetical protein
MARKAFKYLHIVQHISGNVGCISGTRIRRGVANYDRGGKGERVTSRGAVVIGRLLDYPGRRFLLRRPLL